MTLGLMELVELAMFDSMVDAPVCLVKVISGGALWHELSGRSDIQKIMPDILSQMIDNGLCDVAEVGEADGAALAASDARMIFSRALKEPTLQETVQLTVTPAGLKRYHELAGRYYNG